MTQLLFDAPATMTLPVTGHDALFPVHRIFCVGRNYAAHAAEMGVEIDREAPFYFTKSNQALTQTGQTIAYPPRTQDFHYEMELVLAIGTPAFRVGTEAAMDHVFGLACGLDMTRRDLQGKSKAKRQPWDTGKDVENSAVIGPVTPLAEAGDIAGKRITLDQNGTRKQDATLDELIWSLPEIIADLSGLYHLRAGDLIMTGTPAGVGPVSPGDHLSGSIDGLEDVTLTIGDPA